MFVQDNDIIDIKIYYKNVGSNYKTFTEKEFAKYRVNDDKKEEYKVLNVKMKELTWGLNNKMQEEAMVENSKGDLQFNFRIYKENKMGKLLKEWDATSEDGKIVPINRNTLSHLVPSIAETILRAYDDVSVLNEEEEGNL